MGPSELGRWDVVFCADEAKQAGPLGLGWQDCSTIFRGGQYSLIQKQYSERDTWNSARGIAVLYDRLGREQKEVGGLYIEI